ncbi:MAG TPA: methyltransferase domain-containing protein [Thermoanaerobaculia bacterium]|jgi:O-antigen chain-terminating methyltransferase
MATAPEHPDDLKRVLAEEIRAAIAEASPEPSSGSSEADSGTGRARGALRRSEEVLTPSVPDEAPLAAVKRLAIRAARFLWRNQSAFNALSLSAGSELAGEVDRLRAETSRSVDELARRAGVQESRLTLVESDSASRATATATSPGGPEARRSAASAASSAALPAGVYALFEERFRGSREAIEEGQRFYLPFLKDLPGPVLDVGCGRGEFLRLMHSAGIRAKGVDSNPVSAAACRAAGLDVEEGDGVAALSARRSGELGGVVAFQVVEHWPPEEIFRFLQAARRALAAGGVLIAETINADSLSALRAFYLDPTHVRPVPAEALRFLAEAAGFTDTRIEYRSPLPDSQRLKEVSENEKKLNALLFGAQDYALIGRVPL